MKYLVLILFLLTTLNSSATAFAFQQPANPKNFKDLSYYWRAFQIPYGARNFWRDDVQGSIYTNMSGTLASNEVRGMRFQSSGRYTNTQYNLTNSTVWIAYNPNTTSSAFQCLIGGNGNGIYRQDGTGGKPKWYSAAPPANASVASLNVVNTLMLVITNGGSVGYWQDGTFRGTFTAPGILTTTDIGNNQFSNPLNGWISEIAIWTNNTRMSTNQAALLHTYAQRFYMPSFYINPETITTWGVRYVADDALANGSSQVTNIPNRVTANVWPLTNLSGVAATYPILSNNVWNGHKTFSTDGTTQYLANANMVLPTGGNEVVMLSSFNSTVWNTSSNATDIHGRFNHAGFTNANGTNGYTLLALQTSGKLFVDNAKAAYPSGTDADFTGVDSLTNKFLLWNVVNNTTVTLLTNTVATGGATVVGSTSPWHGLKIGVGDVYGNSDYGPFSWTEFNISTNVLTSDQRYGLYNWYTNYYRFTP